MTTSERPDETVDTSEVLEEVESQPESTRPTEGSEDVEAAIVKEQSANTIGE